MSESLETQARDLAEYLLDSLAEVRSAFSLREFTSDSQHVEIVNPHFVIYRLLHQRATTALTLLEEIARTYYPGPACWRTIVRYGSDPDNSRPSLVWVGTDEQSDAYDISTRAQNREALLLGASLRMSAVREHMAKVGILWPSHYEAISDLCAQCEATAYFFRDLPHAEDPD